MEQDNNSIRSLETSLFSDNEEVLRRFKVGVREVVMDHKRAGNTVAGWQEGKVVLIPAEEIDLSVFDEKPRPAARKKKTAP